MQTQEVKRPPVIETAGPVPTAERLGLEPSKCCLCGIDDAGPVGVGEDFEYRTSKDNFLAVKCRRCGLIFLNPRPAVKEAGRIYPDSYHAFTFEPIHYGFVYRMRRWLEARRLLRWCDGLPQDARILDVGCGDGFHLQLLREFGKSTWTLQGIDTDARAIAAADREGMFVQKAAVEDLPNTAGPFHLILLIMTIEHLADPAIVLESVRKLLATGGRVGIITDNVGSPDFKLFGGRHWGGYHFPRHLSLFDRLTLSALAAKAGLEVEDISTAVSPVDWTYSFRNWIDDWGGPRWLVNWLSLRSVLPLALFTLLDIPLAMIGHGAILRASLILRT